MRVVISTLTFAAMLACASPGAWASVPAGAGRDPSSPNGAQAIDAPGGPGPRGRERRAATPRYRHFAGDKCCCCGER